jgi:hypothetical protein
MSRKGIAASRRRPSILADDHDNRERDVDRPVPAGGTEAEGVHAEVVGEGLADAVGVTEGDDPRLGAAGARDQLRAFGRNDENALISSVLVHSV